jgi:hypothetical protein
MGLVTEVMPLVLSDIWEDRKIACVNSTDKCVA